MHACMHIDDLESQGCWHSVLIEGKYTELPDMPDFHNERIYAWSLLQKRDLWWEPGMFKPAEGGNIGAQAPLFYSISVDEISGRQWTADEVA